MKKIFYSVIILLLPIVSFAALEFKPLSNDLPEVLQSGDAKLLLEGWIEVIIGITGILAVIWIVIGGVQYMTTDSFENKKDGKKKIQDALLGLLLAISAWLILYTINENILNINLNYKGQKDQPLTTKEVIEKAKNNENAPVDYYVTYSIDGGDPKKGYSTTLELCNEARKNLIKSNENITVSECTPIE
ncbi:MAG: pilin [Candidatus Pacebacteria bacterium]|nr:pilin [Candidatus Paceibacterota bacterium]